MKGIPMKKFLLTLFLGLWLTVSNVQAKTINMILANPPGSTADILARAFADAYQKISGDNIVLLHRPGGNHVIAAMAFRDSPVDTVLFGSSTIHVYNPVLEKELKYVDADFHHIAVVAYGPAFYVTTPSTGLKTPKDLVTKLAQSKLPMIGGYATAYNLSVDILNRQTVANNKLEIVNYKGGPEVTLGVLSKDISVGLLSATSSTFQLIKDDKLHIIGSTHSSDLVYNGILIPSVSQNLKVPQTSGAYYLSIKPNSDLAFIEEFQKNAKLALETDSMKSVMQNSVVFPGDIVGHNQVVKDLEKFRNTVRKVSQ
jgi:tripartite-type tricarboxylate transporter receptor subunit TctC